MIRSNRIGDAPAWLLGATATMLLLQGCAQKPPPPSGRRLYEIDTIGAAKTCTVGKVALTAGQETSTTMSVANDGGWCPITVANGNGPYDSGLLTTKAAHGVVYIHSVGDATRIDYTPARGFTGTDSFAVTLLPGTPTLRVAATVTPGPASVAPPPAPEPEKKAPPRRTPTHRAPAKPTS